MAWRPILATLAAIILAIAQVQPETAVAAPPPVPTGPGAKFQPMQNLTSEQHGKRVEMSCPVRDVWTFAFKKVGFGKDLEGVTTKGGNRYCTSQPDLDECKSFNPTPQFACRLVMPLLPQAASCKVPIQYPLAKERLIGMTDWLGSSSDVFVMVTHHSCDREYKLESCRYWFNSAAYSYFKNSSLISSDKRLTGQIEGCGLDEAANAEYQKKLARGVTDLNSLLQIKRKIWSDKCGQFNIGCKVKADQLYKRAEREAWDTLEYVHDGDGQATMRAVTAKYDPIAAKELF